MKINWTYIKGVLLLALIVFLVGFTNRKNDIKKVKDVVIEFEEGNNLFMNFQMVNKLLIQKGKELKNQPKSVIDLQLLEKSVLSHPMVEDAAIFLTVDGLLKTRIKQRTPIARVISGKRSYYIDKQAKVMPLSVNHSARVMLISGGVTEEDIEEIHKLVSTVLSDDFLKKQIIGIRKTQNNEFILNTRFGDQMILLGKCENLNKKFKNLISFYKKTIGDNSIENYTTINIKYDNQVVCTKK